MKVTFARNHECPWNCISSTAPMSAGGPSRRFRAGASYDAVAVSRDPAGNVARVELYIGRRWYDIPAAVLTFAAAPDGI